MRKEIRIQIVPIIGRIVGEIILFCNFWKPTVGFMDIAYMRLIIYACIKSDYFELGGLSLDWDKCPQDEKYEYDLFQDEYTVRQKFCTR